jgi:hypothetical protein
VCSHSTRSPLQDLHTPRPEESMLFLSSREVYPQKSSSLGSSSLCLSEDLLSRLRGSYTCQPKLPSPETRYSWSTLTFLGDLGPRAIATFGRYLRFLQSRDPRMPRCRLLDLSPFVGSLLMRPTSRLVNLRGPTYRGHYSLQPTMIHAMHVVSATCALRVLASVPPNLSSPLPRNTDMPALRIEHRSLKFSLATSSRSLD